MSPTYRRGSCACSSIGRGRPPGPPRVRAVVNELRRVACRVCASDARASLNTGESEICNVSQTGRRTLRVQGVVLICEQLRAWLRSHPTATPVPFDETRTSSTGISFHTLVLDTPTLWSRCPACDAYIIRNACINLDIQWNIPSFCGTFFSGHQDAAIVPDTFGFRHRCKELFTNRHFTGHNGFYFIRSECEAVQEDGYNGLSC